MKRLGPIYDLEDGTRLQDLDGGCGSCGKRLAEVVSDPHGQWNHGWIVCIDCGRVHDDSEHRINIKRFYRGGLSIAFCSCNQRSLPGARSTVEQWAKAHQQQTRGAA